MTSERETKALGRLNNAFGQATNLRNFISAIFTAVDDTDGLIEYLRDNRHLEDAEGVWLDNVGEIVGVGRPLAEIHDSKYFEFGDTDEDVTSPTMFEVGQSTGGKRFLQGVNSPNAVYFFPRDNDEKVYKLSKVTKSWVEIGDAVVGGVDFMFLEIEEGPDGKFYALPWTADGIYQLDPKADTFTKIISTSIDEPYVRAYNLGDKIYFVPKAAEYFAYYDTVTGEFVEEAGASLGSGSAKFSSGVFMDDQYLYAAPDDIDDYSYFVKFDTTDDTWENVGAQLTTWNPSYTNLIKDCAKATDFVFYATPGLNDQFVKFNTFTDTWSKVGADLTTEYNPATGFASVISFHYDGYVYLVPYDLDSYIRLDVGTDTWAAYGDLTKPGPQIDRNGFILDGNRAVAINDWYDEVWDLNLDTAVSEFVAIGGFWFGPQPLAGDADQAFMGSLSGANYFREYYPHYDVGFANLAQTEGGMLRGLDGTFLDGVTYVSDDDYVILIEAKAESTFRGSSLANVAEYINDAFGVTGFVGIDGDLDGDWYIELDTYLATKQRRYLVLYAPVPVGSTITISTWPDPKIV